MSQTILLKNLYFLLYAFDGIKHLKSLKYFQIDNAGSEKEQLKMIKTLQIIYNDIPLLL